MNFEAFIGPSYTSQSPNVDAEKCVNQYVEAVESEGGKTRKWLAPVPGLKEFRKLTIDNTENKILGEFEFNGRGYVAGKSLWEVFADGTGVNRGSLGTVGTDPVTFAANQANQILIKSSAGNLFVFATDTNLLSPVNMVQFDNVPVLQIGFVDGYFVAVRQNSNKWQLSALEDGTTWAGVDVNEVSVFAENIVSMAVLQRQIWFFGNKHSVPYYDAGGLSNPFLPIPNILLEQGSAASFATVVMDNSVFWLGKNADGNGMAWRANGYTPARISNHAVEYQWSLYSRIDDAIGYSYQDQGHTFWVIYFPTANATWVFDAATNLWHERQSWDTTTGLPAAHSSRCYMFAFGKHLVGDWKTGVVYEMNLKYFDNNGAPIRRVRQSPHLGQELDWLHISKFQLDLETGLGPIPPLLDGNGVERAPMVSVQWSKDHGHTWSDPVDVGAGKAGEYRTRVIVRRLGRSRDWVFRTIMTDPIPWRVIAAYLDVA